MGLTWAGGAFWLILLIFKILNEQSKTLSTKGNTKLLRLLTKLSCGLNVDQRLIKGQDQMSI